MRRAVEPRAHQPSGAVERLLGPPDRLAEVPVGSAGRVAGGLHAVAERGAAWRDVSQVPTGDHVVGGEGELSVLADEPQRRVALELCSAASGR
jgi:hypothetical protein